MDGLSISAAARERDIGGRVALITDDASVRYDELAERVGKVRGALSGQGIDGGSRVALVAVNRAETVLAILALLELGAAIVPVHPRLTAAEAALVIEDAAPDLVLRGDDLDALVGNERAGSVVSALRENSVAAATALAIVYTSGTTGRSKGAVLSRSAFLASAAASAANLRWNEDDRWLVCMPLCHVGGLSILTRCLLARRTVILEPRFDADAILASIARHRATILSVVPTMLKALLERDHGGILRRLRVVLVGGAATPHSLLDECAARGVPALTTYGLTEACSQVTAQRPRVPYAAEAGSGYALAGVELRVAADGGRSTVIDDVGRIEVRGPTLMSGYWRGPDLSLNRPFDADGWFDTGDLGSLDGERRLFVHARRTDLIVTGGENVYPIEVEQCLEACPGVRRALVFGVPDDRWGQVVAAAVEGEPEAEMQSLSDAVTARLAPHKRPRRLCVVTALPLTGSGKLDRAGAAERYADLLKPFVATRGPR